MRENLEKVFHHHLVKSRRQQKIKFYIEISEPVEEPSENYGNFIQEITYVAERTERVKRQALGIESKKQIQLLRVPISELI